MISPFSGGGYIEVVRGVAKSTRRGEFLLLARLVAELGGLLLLELRELILHGGSEVAHIEEPADLDRYLIVSGDARGPFDRLFARLHINYPVAADHLLRFGERAVG